MQGTFWKALHSLYVWPPRDIVWTGLGHLWACAGHIFDMWILGDTVWTNSGPLWTCSGRTLDVLTLRDTVWTNSGQLWTCSGHKLDVLTPRDTVWTSSGHSSDTGDHTGTYFGPNRVGPRFVLRTHPETATRSDQSLNSLGQLQDKSG